MILPVVFFPVPCHGLSFMFDIFDLKDFMKTQEE